MRRPVAAVLALLCASGAVAQTVSMGGSLGSNALLVIDGKARTVAIGATVDGIRLISVTGNEAVVELKGKRVLLRLGDAQVNLGGKASEGGGKQIVLTAQGGGHFHANGAINGQSVRFMVDTGATITGPNGITRGAPASAVSSSNRCFWIAFQPGPPNCFGQPQPCQPFCPRIFAQRCRSSRVRWIELRTLSLMSLGRLSRTQARICSRKASSSGVKARSIEVSGGRGRALFLARSFDFTCRRRDRRPDGGARR